MVEDEVAIGISSEALPTVPGHAAMLLVKISCDIGSTRGRDGAVSFAECMNILTYVII